MALPANSGRGPARLLAMYRKRPIVGMYINLGLTLLTITFFALFAIRPTALTIFNLVKELNTKKQLTATLDSKISAIFAAQSAYADASPKLEILDETLPQNPSLGEVVNQIQLLADIRQVKVRSMSFAQFNLLGGPVPQFTGKPQNQNVEFVTTPYPFTLAVVGPYSSLYGFLSDIETLRRIVNLSGFGVAQTQGDNNGTTLTLTVSGSVFALTPGQNPTQ